MRLVRDSRDPATAGNLPPGFQRELVAVSSFWGRRLFGGSASKLLLQQLRAIGLLAAPVPFRGDVFRRSRRSGWGVHLGYVRASQLAAESEHGRASPEIWKNQTAWKSRVSGVRARPPHWKAQPWSRGYDCAVRSTTPGATGEGGRAPSMPTFLGVHGDGGERTVARQSSAKPPADHPRIRGGRSVRQPTLDERQV